MRATDEDLLAGALALAYKYADLSGLRAGFARIQSPDRPDLPRALEEGEVVTPARAEKLRRGAALLAQLRADAVYGMVAMRNRLVGAQMLNACMEESKREGYQKRLPEVLLERGVLQPAIHEAVLARAEELLPELLHKEQELLDLIDLRQDRAETAELKLAVLLGEVAARVSFLQRAELEQALRAAERAAQGLPPEELPAPPPPPPAAEIPLPPMPAAAVAPAPVEPVGLVAPPQAQGPGYDGAPAFDPAASAVASAVAAAAGSGGGSTSDSGEQDPIKGYELLLKLGQGAMGAVLKARKRDTGEVVALKILKPELAGDREYVERFLREAKAVARMSHPNVIRAVQAGRSGEYYYFAMEFIEGQTVSELIKAKGALPERFALMVTRCVAGALAHAWEHQIVHRDIKPDNVMITKGGVVKLTDLGLARSAGQDSTLTITGVVMGSPAYISPEQATGEKNLDSRSDIYSLGAALYHMLSGQVPYSGETPLHVMLKHMNDPLPDVRKAVPQVSEATRQLVFKMMAKRPEGRFQTPQEVEKAAQAIEEALAKGQKPPITFAVGPAEPQEQPAERAPARKGPPPKRAAGPTSSRRGEKISSLSQSLSQSQSGERRGASSEEVGERLKRMASKRKRRF